jgi:hypothetical protein
MFKQGSLAVVLGLVVASGTVSFPSESPREVLTLSPETRSVDETEILEVVFRHQIARCYKERSPQVYFLSFKGVDPPGALMERFSSWKIPVKTRSQMKGFRDRQTGVHGVLLAVAYIKAKGAGTAEVRGSCGTEMLDGYDYIYSLVREQGRWRVRKQKRFGVA